MDTHTSRALALSLFKSLSLQRSRQGLTRWSQLFEPRIAASDRLCPPLCIALISYQASSVSLSNRLARLRQ